jgi:hypothetical protein
LFVRQQGGSKLYLDRFPSELGIGFHKLSKVSFGPGEESLAQQHLFQLEVVVREFIDGRIFDFFSFGDLFRLPEEHFDWIPSPWQRTWLAKGLFLFLTESGE